MCTKQNGLPPPRNSSVEALRILAMAMIVLSHICGHSGFLASYKPVSVNRLFVQFSNLGNLGVDLFLLISGFFLWEKPFQLKRISSLLAQVWFYSLTIALGCWLLFQYSYSTQELHAVFMPTIFEEYWFFTAYFVLVLLSPFINALIQCLSRSSFSSLLLLMTILWVLIPTFTDKYMYGTELLQLILFYMIGAYLGKYPDNWFFRKKRRYILTITSFLTLFLLTILLGFQEPYFGQAMETATRLYERNSLLIMGCALGLFSIFVCRKPFYSPVINTLGSCCFGVYLIHDNPAAREILWNHLFWQGHYFFSPSFIPRVILSAALVFVISICIEYLRRKLVADKTAQMVDTVLTFLQSKLNFIWNYYKVKESADS